jgi:serine phosphatase RsbU (regulator of sigma subunit)
MSSANLLDFLNSELKKNLRSKSNEIIRDGMDIGCCIIFNDTLKMQFSGANNPCWIIRENTIIELKANKQAVTAAIEENAQSFTLTEFQLQKNDQIFLFTDGYADQFGGPKGKKFKYKQLEKTLIESTIYSAHEQKNYILNKFSEWKGDLEQVDDVCIVGLRI